MQSDLQSVGNGATSTFARAFAPTICETTYCCFSPRNELDFSPRPIYLELFPAYPGAQLQEIASGAFPIQLGQIRLQSVPY